MGLRCLLGHEYANREVEREREERGDEVVVTYRTVETCDRCGERRVVSENKEVRPIRDPREDDVATGLGGGGVTADLDEPPTDDASAPSEEAPATGGDPAPTADAAAAADEGSTPAATASTGDDAEDEVDPDGTPDPAEEDAVILDDGPTDDGDGDGRARGEWPGADAERPADDEGATADIEAEAEAETEPEPGPVDDGTTVVSGDEGWPEPGGEDEGFDAEPSDGTPTDVSFGGRLTPEGADAAANGEAETTNGGGAVAGKQFVAAEEVEPVSEESTGRTEFFCPNCGYVRTAGGSSMRAGDICPDCHKGYIAERERGE
jgi:hypothetical protein